MTRLPTLFLSHGSPLNAAERTASSDAWVALARKLPEPRAVLMVSAHWETSVPMLTGNPKPETIHDFGGFPEELYRIRYPAPGAPELASEAVALLKEAGIAAGVNGCRGLDHGAWVPLSWMYPDADVPVLQLSLQPGLGTARHVELGRALAPLAADGVLIVGSGHATHNLRDWMANPRRQEPLRYAQAFAEWLHERLAARDTSALVALPGTGAGRRARASVRGALPAAARGVGRRRGRRARRALRRRVRGGSPGQRFVPVRPGDGQRALTAGRRAIRSASADPGAESFAQVP